MAASRAAMTSESKCGRCANLAPLNRVHDLMSQFVMDIAGEERELGGAVQIRPQPVMAGL